MFQFSFFFAFRSKKDMDLALESLASSTRKSYENAWKTFKDLAASAGVAPLPCAVGDLEVIISSFVEKKKKFHALKMMLAAISFFHRKDGFENPCTSPDVRLMVKGAKRMCFVKPKRATPINGQIVNAVLKRQIGEDIWCASYYDAPLRAWRTSAIFMLTFSALCRYDDLKNLEVGNLSFEDNKVLIFIPKSKTDQFGEGQLISVAATGGDVCPAFFLRAYVRRLFWEAALEGIIFDGPLFPALARRRISGPLGEGWSSLPVSPSPMSYKSALADFRDALVGLVGNPEAFSLHSGRRGGATEAISNGCDLLSLKRQGRWRSDSCPQIYVDDVLNCSSRFTSFLRF